MPRLTPGLAFLLSGLRPVVAVVAVIVGVKYLQPTLTISLLSTLAAVAVPIFFVVHVNLTSLSHKRAAARLGARLAPTISGRWPGNFDILIDLMRSHSKGYPADGQIELVERLGPTFNMRLLWDNILFTVDPNNIKTILATDFQNYVKGEKFRMSMDSVLGTGVFNSDGEMWKFHRSMTRPFFSRDRITHFDIFDRHAEDAIERIRSRIREGYPIDFQDAASRFTLDSATEFLFDSCVHSLSAGLPYPANAPSTPAHDPSHPAEAFAAAFLRAQHLISERGRVGWTWPLGEMWEDKTLEPMRVVDGFLGPIVKEALEKRRVGGGKKVTSEVEVEEGDTLLDHLVRLTDDPVVLKDETLNILIAGRDTTASTLTFVTYCLALYPAVLARLREEVLTHIGLTRRPTYDDIRDMKYLRAVINETLRLYPPVPVDVRETVNATTWPSHDPTEKPIYIPAKTSVPYSVFIMHRRKDLWGPDAEEFDPDRFIDHRLKQYLAPNPFIFLPFNAGPRICLGQQFAYNEMSFMLIRLLQAFSGFSLALDAQPPETRVPAEWAQCPGRKGKEKFFPKSHLTMYAHGGLWVNMVEAETSEKI